MYFILPKLADFSWSLTVVKQQISPLAIFLLLLEHHPWSEKTGESNTFSQ
jgi:hypothetical protein